MEHPQWTIRRAATAAVAAGLTVAAALPAELASAKIASAPAAVGPTVQLIAAQKSINVPRFGRLVYLDPGVYVTALGSALRFDVRRASYSRPLTITQVIKVPGQMAVRRPLPAWTLHGWVGLRHFLRLTVRNMAGKTVAEQVLSFCPNSYNPQRATPGSPASSPFPANCVSNPFQLATAWGIQRGWGVDAIANGFGPGAVFRLKLGKYSVTVNVTTIWRRLLHVTPADATAVVKVAVVKPTNCGFPCAKRTARRAAGTSRPLPSLPSDVPAMPSPPASVLPDLVPLPSWNISVHHNGSTKKTPANDQMTFGATIWIGGHARLDVEGFRSNGSPVMPAYQYFWRNGRVIGRARAGTMGFDSARGHDHWHFEQFAEYRLLNSAKSVVVRSQKVGFCIAPTDAINLLLRRALWQPTFTGFGGACGSPSALWVRESLPIGWGDTYFQFIAGQSFNVTHLPNGTYYIEIIANPGRVLHESNLTNDVSLRTVILGGTPGHRTVRVPAWHGIDPEG